MALATSVVSALVGLGFFIMESNICVAVMTCFPALYTFFIIIFWITGTSSHGISTPMSPRAIIIPSETSIIESMLSTPSPFSILAIMLIFQPPFSSKSRRISNTSSAERTKDAATKSISSWIPNKMSCLSFSLR